MTEKTLAISVEATGNKLQVARENSAVKPSRIPDEDSLAPRIQKKERIYSRQLLV